MGPTRKMGEAVNRDDPAVIAFRRAVEEGNVERLRQLFADEPSLASVIDAPLFSFDTPAIVQAAAQADLALIDTLLELGADIDAKSAWEAGPYSALHSLVDGPTPERLALAEALVERGATLDAHAAAGLGRLDELRRILDTRPDVVSAPGPDGATPLHLAHSPEVAAFLLERGAEIDKRCVDHRSTPAMWAAQGRVDVMRFLLKRGAKPDLYQAALLDDVACAAEILRTEPEAIDVRIGFGRSHPHLGGGDKYVWALDGADTPLEVARRHGSERVYEYLLERSRPEAQLLQAARRADEPSLRSLLDQNPALPDDLSEADLCDLFRSSAGAVRILAAAGLDPNPRDGTAGATPLHWAAWHGLTELVEALLDVGADASLRDQQYLATPLGWANENHQEAVMETILDRWDPGIVDAAWLGRADRVEDILSRQPEAVDGFEDGRLCPLRAAVWTGHTEVVRILLRHGADPSRPHPDTGQTALDYAHEQGRSDLVELLSPT